MQPRLTNTTSSSFHCSEAIRSVPGVKRAEESPSVSVEENLLYLDPRDIEIKKNYLSLNIDVDNKFYDNKL